MPRPLALLPPTLALLLSTACPAPPPPAPEIPGQLEVKQPLVLKAGELGVSQEMLDSVTARMSPPQLERMKQSGQFDDMLQQIGLGEAMYKRALEAKLHEDPRVRVGIAMAVHQYLAGEWLQHEVEARLTDEALRARYEERRAQYAQPQAKLVTLVVKQLPLAEELKAQVQAGADLGALAAEHSIDPASRNARGDVGWVDPARLPGELSEAIRSANVGDLVGPVETRFGFQLARVVEKRDSTPFEDAREALAGELRRSLQDEIVEQLRASYPLVTSDGRKLEPRRPGGSGGGPPRGMGPPPGPPRSGPGAPPPANGGPSPAKGP
jgi:hypothetical protein